MLMVATLVIVTPLAMVAHWQAVTTVSIIVVFHSIAPLSNALQSMKARTKMTATDNATSCNHALRLYGFIVMAFLNTLHFLHEATVGLGFLSLPTVYRDETDTDSLSKHFLRKLQTLSQFSNLRSVHPVCLLLLR
jgi:hypothetical protein